MYVRMNGRSNGMKNLQLYDRIDLVNDVWVSESIANEEERCEIFWQWQSQLKCMSSSQGHLVEHVSLAVAG